MQKKERLQEIYISLSSQFQGNRFYTISHFFELFEKNTKKLRAKLGAMHCTNINRLLIEDLLNSGLFTKQDIRKRWTLLWYVSPHQYMQIKTEEGWINVDIWAKNFGIQFGDYAHGWHI